MVYCSKINCRQGQATRRKCFSCQIEHLLFSHIHKYLWTQERKCFKSYRPLQHRNSVMRFKVENLMQSCFAEKDSLLIHAWEW